MTDANSTHDTVHLRDAFNEILEKARRAPSGVNTQPWQLLVIGPATARKLADVISADSAALLAEAARQFPTAREASLHDEFNALHAPLFALCTIDERLGLGSELDYGMFLQNVRLLASAQGLEASVWPAWRAASALVRRVLEMPNQRVLCALTLAASKDKSAVGAVHVAQTRWVE
jgi:nitroreductase